MRKIASSISFGSCTLQNSAQSSFKKLSGPLHRVENHRHAGRERFHGRNAMNVSISEAIKRASVWLKIPQHLLSVLRPTKDTMSFSLSSDSGLFIKNASPARRRQSYTKTIFPGVAPARASRPAKRFPRILRAQCGNRRLPKMCRVFVFFCAVQMLLGVDDVRQNFGRYIVFFFKMSVI